MLSPLNREVNSMRKLTKYLFLAAICFVSFSLFSAEDVEEAEGAQKIEIVMMNVSNQFIYSFFGRDLLLYYLNDKNDIESVQKASEADLALLAQPFNAVIGKMMMMALTVVYGVTLGYFIIRLSLTAAEILWMIQRDGESHINFKDRRGLIVKIILFGGLAVIPISMKNDLVDETYYTNAATAILFDLLGRANSFGDESIDILVDSQRQTLKTLTMPSADSKKESALSLNSFFTCTRLLSEREKVTPYYESLDLYLNFKGGAEGYISVGDCTLYVVIGLDNESDKKLKKINRASPELGLDDDLFESAQKDVYLDLLPSVFYASMEISEELAKPEYSSTWEDGAFSLKKHTSAELSVSELKKWPVRCDELKGWTSEDGDLISRRDRVYLHNLSARCISREIADKLVYPDSYEAMSNFLGNGTEAQKELALCVDQASLTDTLSSNRYVAEYGIGANDGRSTSIQQIALDSCIVDLCSKSGLNSGNLYSCANALDLYETRLRDVKLKNRGTMMLGFYMFDLFLHHPPSPSAKRVFNNLSFSFSPHSFEIKDKPETEPFLKIGVEIPAVTGSVLDMNPIILDLSRTLAQNNLPTINIPLPATESLATKAFGYNRLETCAKNPLQVHGGFVCGNIPQEFSRFGMTVLKTAVTLKTALLMGQTSGMMKRARVGPGGSTVEGYMGNTFVKNAIRKTGVVTMGLITGDGDSFGNVFDSVFSLEWGVTDEFGYLNSSKMNPILSSLPAMAFSSLSYIGADSSFLSVIDGVLLVMLIVGVLFAIVFPLFPMIMVMNALIKFSYLLFNTMIMHGKKFVDVAFDRDFDILSDRLDSVWADWIALILKLPLTIIGVVLAWLMSSVILSHVLNTMNLMVPTNDGIQGLLDLFVSMLVSGVIILVIYNTVLTIIESFYDFTVEWVLSSMHNNPFASETKGVGWQDAKEVLHLMGR